jgi:hypothetical protein
MEQHSPSNQNTLKIGLVVLLGALGLLGYLYYGAQNENADLQKMLTGKVDELSTTKVKLDSISLALDAKIAEVTALGGSVEELIKIKAQLERDKKSLRSDANFSVKKYEGKIAEYEAFLTLKDEEIMKLKEENGQLNSQNITLQTEKEEVINQNRSLNNTKDSLSTKVAEVSTQNEDLRRKVNVGSALKAVNVQVTGLTSRGKEKNGELKNRKVDQLKVSFILPSNPLTERNNKEIYLRALDPNGAVLNDMAKGGMLNFANQEIGYSLRQNTPYTNDDQKVDMYYKKEAAFKSGKYTIELFSEGFKIGTGSFFVK